MYGVVMGFVGIGSGGAGITAGNYTGVFNGNGHTISNLSLANPAGMATYGLITTNAGTVENVGLIDTNINAAISANVATTGGGVDIGALVGLNFGIVNNVFDSGTVTVTESAVGERLGGIVGVNGGLNGVGTQVGIINDAYNLANVNGSAVSGFYIMGGIAGSNGLTSTINASYNVGDIVPLTGQQAGAIAGRKSTYRHK